MQMPNTAFLTPTLGHVPTIPAPERLLTAIKLAEVATQTAKEAVLARTGVTKAQYNALLVLHDSSGLTNSELARRCFVTPQSMNETVGRLERDGFVSRQQHETHRHVVEIRITPAGKGVFRAADKEVVGLERRLRGELTSTEIDHLWDLLRRLTQVD